jgi:class 3 adenylate cyclase
VAGVVNLLLENGSVLKFETDTLGEEYDPATPRGSEFHASEITQSLQAAIELLKESVERVAPDKASVTFGIKIGIESGRVTALVVKGSSEANLTFTLEWSKAKQTDGS